MTDTSQQPVAETFARSVAVRRADGSTSPLALTASLQQPWRIDTTDPAGATTRYEAPDLFRAMQQLRLDLERAGQQLLCAGARSDVAVSGMLGSTTGGRYAYILRAGEPASRDHTVDIFSDADPAEVGTVQQQRDFLNQRVQSLSAMAAPSIQKPS